MENMEINPALWQGKRVFVTGHTGFKGSWLSLWLHKLGAQVHGYALAPPTSPSHFEIAEIHRGIHSHIGDITDLQQLRTAMQLCEPELVIHLAAQSLVRPSYAEPVATFETNVMGTVNVLEACRHTDSVRALINVTSDKCYDNPGSLWGLRETDPMGGEDPYSSSKGCAELVTAAYRASFFNPSDKHPSPKIASVRAGNVIGGGDWSPERLVPDILTAFAQGKTAVIRNPEAVRPWQHVLDVLNGYLLLAQQLLSDENTTPLQALNFGPQRQDEMTVGALADLFVQTWGGDAVWEYDRLTNHPHEAHQLRLDSSKAQHYLNWSTRLPVRAAAQWTVDWYRAYASHATMREVSLAQLNDYQSHKV